MKKTVALILLLIGTALMILGFVMAVIQLAGLYGSALDNAMTDGPDPKTTSSTMLTWVIVGAIGVVPATVGSMMLGKSLLAHIAKALTPRNETPKR